MHSIQADIAKQTKRVHQMAATVGLNLEQEVLCQRMQLHGIAEAVERCGACPIAQGCRARSKLNGAGVPGVCKNKAFFRTQLTLKGLCSA